MPTGRNVYLTKGEQDVSWFQQSPRISLDLIHATGVTTDASIIDIGGGASRLVDLLRARSMIRYAHSPGVPFTVEFSTGLCRTSSPWGSILHVARQQTGSICATGSK